MKYSGIPWIGDIPRGWVMKRLKDVGFLYGGLTGKAGDDFIAEEDESCNYMRFIPFTNIFNNTIINPNQLYKVRIEDGEKQNLVNKNDILFLMSSEDYDGVGKPAILEEQIENLSLNSFCKGFRVTNVETHPKYLLYLLLSHVVRELVRQEAKGFIRINLRQDKLSTCPIMLPSLSEQQKIASFLDRKCSEIDEMIALQEKIVEELKAYKQSVITEVVTKGLNPDVPMKDSGIEWIGEIPEHWEAHPFKAFYKTTKGLNITKDNLVESGIPVISYGQIHSKQNTGTSVSEELIRYVPADYIDSNPECLSKKYDIFFADTSEDREGAGNIALIDVETPIFAGYHTIMAHPSDRVKSKYIAYLIKTDAWRCQLRCKVQGVKLFSISQKFVNQASIIVPPMSEQIQISEYLDTKCTEIDNLISIKLSKIDSLKEYKKSIIYEYVTGKKEVIE